MKESRILMGMPITVEVVESASAADAIGKVFEYFAYVDETFSTYKENSEISRINRHEISEESYIDDVKEVMLLSRKTQEETHGFFNIRRPDGTYDPSGLVKGWAITNAAKLLDREDIAHFCIEAGGDIETRGRNEAGGEWTVGIRDPFAGAEARIVKTLFASNKGIATSGTYLRGQHIYDPHGNTPLKEFVSLTVIGPNAYEADRFATAAFAMGRQGIHFIESLQGLEGYMINVNGIATMTSGFETYTHSHA
jgi:thiamine biosynthesis lipoprotein